MTNDKDDRMGLPSASGIERIMLCPASFIMEKEAQRWQAAGDEVSVDAEEGTMLHAAMSGEVDESTLNDEQLTTIRRGESILADAIEIVRSSEGAESYDDVPQLGRLWAHDGKGFKVFSGELDWCCAMEGKGGRVALIADWKFGRGDVSEAACNYQLAAYACLLQELSLCTSTYYVAIIRPRASKENELTLSKYTNEDVTKLKKVLIDSCKKAANGCGDTNPGVKQCKYCKAKSICLSAHKEVTEISKINVSGTGIGVVSGKLLEACTNAEKIIDAIRDRAKAMLSEDINSIPGWTLKDGSSRSSITDATKAFQILSDKMTTEDFCSAVTVSLAKLVKPWQSSSGIKSQKSAREDLESRLSEVIETKQSAKTLSKE